MTNKKPDISADMDRGEPTSLMEPLYIASSAPQFKTLQDLALQLAVKSAAFRASLPKKLQISLAKMICSMNCYYSNLIEGHNTHPIDIERALRNDYSADQTKRNLQLEAKAHIEVQQWIDEGGAKDEEYTVDTLCTIHRRFCELLPDELLFVFDNQLKTKKRLIPGELRKEDVLVGSHVAVSPGAVERFLQRFAVAYSQLGKVDTIIAAAAAHHRFLWIHPFMDGNGRVARLMSHAVLHNTLDTGGLWSIARGLARRAVTYKQHLANCDLSRRNDLDGRGNLSQESLIEFTQFFLETCLDQIDFMQDLMQPAHLHTRVLLWAEEESRLNQLPAQAIPILEAVLFRGELSRSEVPALLKVTDRQGRRVIAALVEKQVLTSDTPKSALYLQFPAVLASRWMPGLFPDN